MTLDVNHNGYLISKTNELLVLLEPNVNFAILHIYTGRNILVKLFNALYFT